MFSEKVIMQFAVLCFFFMPFDIIKVYDLEMIRSCDERHIWPSKALSTFSILVAFFFSLPLRLYF